MANNTWQLCPKCNGDGIVTSFHGTTCNASACCPVCNGKMIISHLTGLPPKDNIAKEPEYTPLPTRNTEDTAWKISGF